VFVIGFQFNFYQTYLVIDRINNQCLGDGFDGLAKQAKRNGLVDGTFPISIGAKNDCFEIFGQINFCKCIPIGKEILESCFE